MARSYKIHKSYHTSHHNTTKNHLQISTPPSNVQQRADPHNLPPSHRESHSSKLQASSNAPTLTTSLQTTGNLSLSSQPSSAALMAHPTPVRPLYPSHHDRTVWGLQQKSGCFGVSLGPYLASEVSPGLLLQISHVRPCHLAPTKHLCYNQTNQKTEVNHTWTKKKSQK